MKALVIGLSGLFLSQAAHAAGCSEADAKRLVAERIVAHASGADFSEVKVHIVKDRAGSRQNPIVSIFGSYIIPGENGSNQYGWVNAEIQPRNPCFNSGSSSGDISDLRNTTPEVNLSDYLRENQLGSLMRSHTPRSTMGSSQNELPAPTPSPVASPTPSPVAAPVPSVSPAVDEDN
ncbi:MAG: hypothetical protein K0R29_804 [Pseudobdellovibrio sp.]|jgi:hypothetical protein|nr:hypothetical protein [Pseudobdellovibrio sp.]